MKPIKYTKEEITFEQFEKLAFVSVFNCTNETPIKVYKVLETECFIIETNGLENKFIVLVEGNEFEFSTIEEAENKVKNILLRGKFLKDLEYVYDKYFDFCIDYEVITEGTQNFHKAIIGKKFVGKFGNGWERYKKLWNDIQIKAQHIDESEIIKIYNDWSLGFDLEMRYEDDIENEEEHNKYMLETYKQVS